MTAQKLFILQLLLLPLYSLANDSSWTAIRINEDLVASLPGNIDSAINMKAGPYTFNFYSGNIFSNLYMVQVTPQKAGLSIYDTISYNNALTSAREGILQGLRTRSMIAELGDTVMNGIRMKTVITDGFRIGTRARLYIFILNDRVYQVGAFQGNRDLSDTRELQFFLSSLQFTNNIQEKMFNTPGDANRFKLAKLIEGLISLAIIGLIVYFVVRRITS